MMGCKPGSEWQVEWGVETLEGTVFPNFQLTNPGLKIFVLCPPPKRHLRTMKWLQIKTSFTSDISKKGFFIMFTKWGSGVIDRGLSSAGRPYPRAATALRRFMYTDRALSAAVQSAHARRRCSLWVGKRGAGQNCNAQRAHTTRSQAHTRTHTRMQHRTQTPRHPDTPPGGKREICWAAE